MGSAMSTASRVSQGQTFLGRGKCRHTVEGGQVGRDGGVDAGVGLEVGDKACVLLQFPLAKQMGREENTRAHDGELQGLLELALESGNRSRVLDLSRAGCVSCVNSTKKAEATDHRYQDGCHGRPLRQPDDAIVLLRREDVGKVLDL